MPEANAVISGHVHRLSLLLPLLFLPAVVAAVFLPHRSLLPLFSSRLLADEGGEQGRDLALKGGHKSQMHPRTSVRLPYAGEAATLLSESTTQR